MAAKANVYRRLPQGSKSIRVLNVHAPAVQGGDEEPIQADLSIIDLDQQPQFTALSYVWGLRSPQLKTVTIGTCIFDVTDNCHSALKHLRRKLGTFVIWIDALCINQEDGQEKSEQMPLMGDIYSRARATYIWLGEGNAATERAMHLMTNTGLLEYYFVDGNPDGAELPSPRLLGAFWSSLTARWSRSRQPIPLFKRTLSKGSNQ